MRATAGWEASLLITTAPLLRLLSGDSLWALSGLAPAPGADGTAPALPQPGKCEALPLPAGVIPGLENACRSGLRGLAWLPEAGEGASKADAAGAAGGGRAAAAPGRDRFLDPPTAGQLAELDHTLEALNAMLQAEAEVPEDAMRSLRELFALVAMEGRERVGAPEVVRLLAILGLQHSPAEVRRVLLRASTQGADRRIGLPDFVKAILDLRGNLASKRDLQRAFGYLAGDGLPAGYISASALHKALATHCADSVGPSEAAALATLPLRLQGGVAQLPAAVLDALPDDTSGLICISDLINLVRS
ncbi:hypothetical protein WJX81_001183 [Elliptochloris bilobata]|uniref:EF-hand domain-containing protein n=1 Tax=Elliptochloris bilobata TaxID=381761 RepID=A0AAW1RDW4_9CHLO